MLNQAARFPSSSETFLGQNQIPPASTNLPAKRKRTEGSFPSSNSNCAELNPSFGTEMRNGLLSFGHNLGSKVFYAVNSDPNCKIFYEIENPDCFLLNIHRFDHISFTNTKNPAGEDVFVHDAQSFYQYTTRAYLIEFWNLSAPSGSAPIQLCRMISLAFSSLSHFESIRSKILPS
eukprot:Sdes_comp18583_c0_seq1m8707